MEGFETRFAVQTKGDDYKKLRLNQVRSASQRQGLQQVWIRPGSQCEPKAEIPKDYANQMSALSPTTHRSMAPAMNPKQSVMRNNL
jgi:hypothetical protein